MNGSQETEVERLTVVSDLGSLRFDPVVHLRPGDAFWVQGDTLHIRRPDGTTREVPGDRSERIPGKRYLQPGLGQQDA